MDNTLVAHAILLDAMLAQAEGEIRERDAAVAAAEEQRRADQQRAEAEAEAAATAQREREAAAAEVVRRRRRREMDYGTGIVSGVAAASVLVPWAVGHYVLRGRAFVESPEVFDPEIRALLPYIWAEVVGGWAVIALLTGAVLALRPWTGRIVFGAAGVALLVGGFWLFGYGKSLFTGAEADSASKLWSTAFPFDDYYRECGSPFELIVRPPEGSTEPDELWQLHLAQAMGYEGSGCNRVDVYRGHAFVGRFDLPPGEEFDDGTEARWGYTYATNDVFGSGSWLQNHDPAGVWLNARTTWGRVVSTNLVDVGNGGLAFR